MKVYPVDLMRLYLTRRNLERHRRHRPGRASRRWSRRPSRSATGRTSTTRPEAIDLPLTKEGAYLVMVRGDNLYASGIVLVTPLELEVLEDRRRARAGRVAPDDRARRRDQGARAQGPGQGDRQRRPAVPLGRDRPPRRLRRRRRARSHHGRRPQGDEPVRLLSRHPARRRPECQHCSHAADRPARPAQTRRRPTRPSTPTSRCRTRQIPSGRSSGCSSATTSRPRTRRERRGSVPRRRCASATASASAASQP